LKPAYAIVRHDLYYSKETPIEHKITIKKVVLDLAYAESEVERLNKINEDKRCYYFWQYTRIEEDQIGGE
jgi:hypothetical protein